jgi:hypothetical protein
LLRPQVDFRKTPPGIEVGLLLEAKVFIAIQKFKSLK